MRARTVGSGEQARRDVMAMLPDGATVMNVTSTTLDQLGLSKEIEEATRFDSIRKRIIALPQSEQRAQMRRLTAAADVAVGSVHAITEDGQIIVASNSGSQLALYVFCCQSHLGCRRPEDRRGRRREWHGSASTRSSWRMRGCGKSMEWAAPSREDLTIDEQDLVRQGDPGVLIGSSSFPENSVSEADTATARIANIGVWEPQSARGSASARALLWSARVDRTGP